MIRSLNIEYFKPALLDDLLQVAAADRMGRSRIAISQQVLRGPCYAGQRHRPCGMRGRRQPQAVRVPAPLRHKLGKRS